MRSISHFNLLERHTGASPETSLALLKGVVGDLSFFNNNTMTTPKNQTANATQWVAQLKHNQDKAIKVWAAQQSINEFFSVFTQENVQETLWELYSAAISSPEYSTYTHLERGSHLFVFREMQSLIEKMSHCQTETDHSMVEVSD